MNNIAKIYGSIFIAACLISVVFIVFDSDGREIKGDAIIYYRITDKILNGHGFSDAESSPDIIRPTMSREPVYPFFLSFLLFLFKKNILLIQITQALIYALTCLVIFKIYYMCFDKKIAFIGAIVFALFPTIPSYTPYLLTEVLFTFLLAVSILGLMNAFKYDSLRWFFYTGLTIGAATLCRAVLMLFFIFIILAIFLYYFRKDKKILNPKVLKASIILLLGYFLIVTPWILRNYAIFGKPSITLRGYSTTYTRAVKVNLSGKELKMYTAYCFSEYLASKLYPDHNFSSTSKGYFYQPAASRYKEFSALGLSSEEQDRKFKEETLFLIHSHPVKFIGMGFFEFFKFNSFSQVLLLNDKKLEKSFNDNYFLPVLRGFLKLLGIIMALFSFYIIISRLRFIYNWLPIACVIFYFNSVHFFLDSTGRYALPIIPYYFFFIIIGVTQLKKKYV